MKHLVALILLVVGFCDAHHLVCQRFDQSEKSLEKYCNENATVPANCAKEINPIESSQVEKLIMRGCDPNFVLDTVKALANLRVLDISYSGYKTLDWLNFKFNQLQIFNASHNELLNLSQYSFKNTPKIVEIDLSHNNLQRNTLPYFKGLEKLKKLHLSNNDIFYSVDGRYFDSINLEYIDLQSNGLVSIPNPDAKENLKVMHLEKNPISFHFCSYTGDTSFPSLSSLYFSWKAVDWFEGDTHRCEGKRMHIVKNTTFEGILMTKNRKYEMHCQYKCLESIYSFRAGCDTFENVTEVMQNFGSSIRTIDLSKNFVGELNTNSLERFIDLQELNLSETNLTKFDFDMLRNNNHLSLVDISNNKLKHLSNVASLQNCHELRILNMAGNQIEHADEIFEYLNPSLKELDVSGNTVGNLSSTAFQRLPYLQRLNMKNTKLTLSNNTNPFETLRSLTFLDLSQNNLENVIFSTLSIVLNNLSELTLSDCRIKNISVVIQHLGSSLRKLDLSKNFAQGLNDRTFQTLEKLEVLNLSDTNLLTVNSNPFKYQQNLHVLDLSNNKLKAFDLKLLPINNVHYLNRLNLERNDLTELTNLRGSNFKNVGFKLGKNQFPCTYVKELSKSKNVILVGESWLQKDDKDCRSSAQSVNDFLISVYDNVKFW